MAIEALYAQAESILRPLAGNVKIPLRLDEKRGQLISALPRMMGAAGLPFSCPDVPRDGCFSALEEIHGMLVFTISQDWYRSELEGLNELSWAELPAETGLSQNDPDNEAFLLLYTVRRCRRIWENDGGMDGGEALPAQLVLALIKGTQEPAALAERYWRLTPSRRRNRLLAGAVGRSISLSFTKNSPTTHHVRYNEG